MAAVRAAATRYDRPWYRSATSVLDRHDLRGLRCLDLCCGNAEFSEILRRDFGMQVTCADYAAAHLDHAHGLGFDVLRVDFDEPEDVISGLAAGIANRFDLVVSLATIEHVFDSDTFLRFAHTVLKPDGLFLVNTPNINFSGYRFYSRLSGNRPFGEGHHVRFWDFRFLRTNLFLNGFHVIEDVRRFFGLPRDTVTRAMRGHTTAASAIAWLFHACAVLQHLPGGRNRFTDELTILAQKEAVYPVGFSVARVQAQLARLRGTSDGASATCRLKEARGRGWLNEHLVLAGVVDGLKT